MFLMGESRSARLINNVISSLFFRFFGLIVTILMTPLLVGSLSADQYALFVIIISFSTFVAYSDLGLGMGMVNDLVGCDNEARRKALACVFWVLVFVAFGIIVIGVVVVNIFAHEKWQSDTWLTFIILSSIAVPLGLGHRVLFALEKIHISNLCLNIGRAGSLLAVYLVSLQDGAALWVYVLAFLGVPSLMNFGLWIWLSWNFSFVRVGFYKKVFKGSLSRIAKGGQFLVLQLAVFFDSIVDVIFIGIFYEGVVVRDFDLLSKIYIYVPAIVSVGLFPLWPSLRSALKEGDSAWVSIVLNRSIVLVVGVSVLVSLVLYFHIYELVKMWSGIDVMLGKDVVLGLSAFAVLTSVATLQAMYLNAQDEILIQSVVAVLFIGVVALVKLMFLKYLDVGSMVIAGAVVYGVKILVLHIIYQKGGRSC